MATYHVPLFRVPRIRPLLTMWLAMLCILPALAAQPKADALQNAPELAAGDDFVFDGLTYTVIDPAARTCRTKDGGRWDGSGNTWEGSLIIPETVSDGNDEYTVVEIGEFGFYMCTELTSITLPNTVTKIAGYAFCGCTGLTSIDLPSALAEIDVLAFTDCRSLTEITFPNSLTAIRQQAFQSCTGLTSITLPQSLTTLDILAFMECENIESVTYEASIPIEAQTRVFEVPVYMCAQLSMPNALIADVMSISPWNQFRHITAKDGSVTPGSEPGDFVYEGIVYTIIDSEARTCSTKAGDRIYCGNYWKGDLVIPQTVSDGEKEYTVVEIADCSFSGCKTLSSIVLPNSVTKIGAYAFENCSGLTSITLPNAITSVGERAFYSCVGLTSIDLPNTLSTIGNYAFGNCVGLTSLTLPYGLTTFGEGAFSDCSNLVSVDFPNTLEVIPDEAFSNCGSLESVVLASATTIGFHAFYGCINLESIILQAVTFIGSSAFSKCSSLTTVELPETLTTISTLAFSSCTNLTSLSLPASLIEIAQNVFANCSNIATVAYMAATPVAVKTSLFASNVYANALLKMPNATLEDVQATTPWNKFQHIQAKDGSSDTKLVYESIDFGIDARNGAMWLKSGTDRAVSIFRIDGTCVRTVDLKAGETVTITDLAKGIYIVAGQKIIMR